MPEIARTHAVGFAETLTDTARTSLEVVVGWPETQAGAEIPTDEPNTARSAMIGYAIGFAVACVGLTIGGTIAGLGFGPSLGLGAFIGMWGGGGFGFMVGATIPLARHLDACNSRPMHTARRENP
jgi:hypothetical protein